MTPFRCLSLVLFLPLSSAGCGEPDPPPPIAATLAGLEIEVSAEPPRLEIRRGDEILLDGLPGADVPAEARRPHVAWASRRAEASYEFSYGSFKIEENNPPPWEGVAALADLRLEGDAIHFSMQSASGTELGTARIGAAGDGELELEFLMSGDANRASMAFGCAPDEHFLGFGGQSFDVDHRGQTVPLWVQEDGIGKVEIDDYLGLWFLEGRRHSTHTPMPIYLSSRGYALALDTPYRSIFSMCSEAEDVVRVEAWEGALRLRLFSGPTPAEMVAKLTAWTGRPEVPPAFAFAPWLDAIHGEENVRRIADKVRQEDLAVAALWTEDWRGGEEEGGGYVLDEDWELDREQYPNFEALAGELHDEGYKFLVYHNPFLTSTAPVFDEAVAAGYPIRDSDGGPYLFEGVKFAPTTLLDLSNPEAWEWAKQKYLDSLELGADGYMADFAEWLPTDAVLASGESALMQHNLYPLDWQRLQREVLDAMQDGVERLFFVRSAYLGSQPLVSVVWAGDQQTDFSRGDGYPSVIPMGIGLGVTGFPYYGHDIGGYMSQGTEPTTEELWYRWVTLGALTPVMRTHHGREALRNWHWERDDASIAHMRRWTRFHMQLFPYLSELAERAAATGAPLFRPLAYDYPEFSPGWTSVDQFMLGDRLIVAPVVVEGESARSVALPPGTFYPLFGGDAVSGTVAVRAPKEDIPVFAPAGALLVLAPERLDTTEAVAASSGAVTWADIGDDRELWLYPGGASEWSEHGLDYSWTAAALAAAPQTTTWQGAPLEWRQEGAARVLDVVGPGTLDVDGAKLVIGGGAPARSTRIRLYGLP